jgi:hypothetical protein
MVDEIETKLKKVLEQISDLAPEPMGASELLRKKAYEHRRARGITLSMVPVLLIALFFAVTAFPVFAGQENLLQFYASQKIAQELNNWNGLALGKLGDEGLASELGVPEEEISALRVAGYGYGEIVLMVQLSRASGEDLSQIREMRERGLGWGRIASDLEVSLRGASAEMERERERLRQRLGTGSSEVPQGSEEKPNPPGQQGPFEKPTPPGHQDPTDNPSSSGQQGQFTNSISPTDNSSISNEQDQGNSINPRESPASGNSGKEKGVDQGKGQKSEPPSDAPGNKNQGSPSSPPEPQGKSKTP